VCVRVCVCVCVCVCACSTHLRHGTGAAVAEVTGVIVHVAEPHGAAGYRMSVRPHVCARVCVCVRVTFF